jgi:tetratricopeptide (TPR) repeat protein
VLKQSSNGIDRGIQLFRQAIEICPTRLLPELHFRLAKALQQRRRVDQAIGEFEKVVALSSQKCRGGTAGLELRVEAHKSLASIYKDQKDGKRAIQEYELALQASPKDVSILFSLAMCYSQFENNDGAALRYFRRLLKKEPYFWTANLFLAGIYERRLITVKQQRQPSSQQHNDELLPLHDRKAYLGCILRARIGAWLVEDIKDSSEYHLQQIEKHLPTVWAMRSKKRDLYFMKFL